MTTQFSGTTKLSNDHEANGVDVTSEEGRAALAKMVTKLFDLWGLPGAAQASLLGLATTSRASLLFPYDRDLAYSWVTCPNRAFNGKSPLDVMLEYRFAGLLRVRAYLDFARGR